MSASAPETSDAHAASAPQQQPVDLTLADGRRMRVREYGAAGGRPVIALHGLPGSGSKFSLAHGIARDLGLRIVAPDRWAYGGTSVHPTPTLSRFGDDIAELCGQLSLTRIGVLGVSGGGPYAAAVAARLGERVVAAALVSPVGPVTGPGAPDLARIGAFHRLCFGHLPRVPATLAAVFHVFRFANRRVPRLACWLTTARAPAIDRATLAHPEVGARLNRTFREGLEPGVGGPLTDMALFSRPWDVGLDRIAADARVWIGTLDRNVPIAAAESLAAAIPGASLVTLPDVGHLWLAQNYATVLGWVAARFKPTI